MIFNFELLNAVLGRFQHSNKKNESEQEGYPKKRCKHHKTSTKELTIHAKLQSFVNKLVCFAELVLSASMPLFNAPLSGSQTTSVNFKI